MPFDVVKNFARATTRSPASHFETGQRGGPEACYGRLRQPREWLAARRNGTVSDQPGIFDPRSAHFFVAHPVHAWF